MNPSCFCSNVKTYGAASESPVKSVVPSCHCFTSECSRCFDPADRVSPSSYPTLSDLTSRIYLSKQTMFLLSPAGSSRAAYSGAGRALKASVGSRNQARAYGTSKDPNYPGHIPLSTAQNALLAVGSGVVGVLDTSRGGQP